MIIDPITLSFIGGKIWLAFKAGLIALLIVQVFSFKHLKNWILDRWHNYVDKPNVLACSMRLKREAKEYAETMCAVFVDRVSGEILEGQAFLAREIHPDVASKHPDGYVVIHTPGA